MQGSIIKSILQEFYWFVTILNFISHAQLQGFA